MGPQAAGPGMAFTRQALVGAFIRQDPAEPSYGEVQLSSHPTGSQSGFHTAGPSRTFKYLKARLASTLPGCGPLSDFHTAAPIGPSHNEPQLGLYAERRRHPFGERCIFSRESNNEVRGGFQAKRQ